MSVAKCETGVGWSSSGHSRFATHPARSFHSRSTLPLQGGWRTHTLCIETETLGPFLMVW
jgi:hypothetical protein